MARTAPIPNIPPIPGMCPGLAVLGGGGGGGGGSGNGAGEGGADVGAGGEGGAEATDADGRSADGTYPGCGTASHPVDVVTGRAYTHPVKDLWIPGALTLEFERSYSSTMAKRDAGLGYGWGHSFGWEVEVRRRFVRVRTDKGLAVDFPKIAVGAEVVGKYGWLLRRDQHGYLLDPDQGRWYVMREANEDGDRFRLSALQDRNGNCIRLDYERGRLKTVTDMVGREVDVTTDEHGRITRLRMKNAPSQGAWIEFGRYVYDEHGNMVSATDADGHTAHYRYDGEHRLTLDQDRAGLRFHFCYDDRGRCVEAWGDYGDRPDPSLDPDLSEFLADGRTRAKGIHHCVFSYFEGGYTEVLDSTELRRFYGNEHGLLDKRVDGGGVTTSEYDERGRLTAITDAIGATWRYKRDPRGRVVEEIDPYGKSTTYDRTRSGVVERVVDALGHETIVQRDERGNMVRYVEPTGGTLAVQYDEAGNPVTFMDELGGTHRFRYDDYGNLVTHVLPSGGTWQYTYDYFSRRTSRTDPLGHTTRYRQSNRGDLLAITDERTGGSMTYEYDGEGHLVRDSTRGNNALEFVWGGYNRLCTRVEADGSRLELRYGREGQLLYIQNEKGERHRFEYSDNMRLLAEHTFDGRTVRYRRDDIGQLTQVRSSDGRQIDFTWGLTYELLERVYQDDSAEKFQYDALGNLVCMISEDAEVRFEHDACGRVLREVQVIGGVEHEVRSRYDAKTRIHRETSLGHTEDVTRDISGARLETVLDGKTSVEHAIDLLGREVRRQLPFGGVIETDFDAEDRVLRRTSRRPGDMVAVGPQEPDWIGKQKHGVTAELAFLYDVDGTLVEQQDSERGATTFEYDPRGRLLQMAGPAAKHIYRYDAVGNRYDASPELHRADAAYDDNRLVRHGDAELRYDEGGYLMEKRTPEGTTTYTWNGAGRLRRVDKPDGTRVEFFYDARARRLEKRVYTRDGNLPRLTSKTRFVWDQRVLVHEVREQASASGDPVVEERTYCFEDESTEPMLQRVGKGEWHHYLNGAAGQPERLVGNDGSVVAELRWEAWGGATHTASSKTDTPIRLQGQYEDQETGLHYNHHRYFDPKAGRFISPDPAGLDGGLHPFTFAPNVWNWVDPSGLLQYHANGAPTLLGRDMRRRIEPTADNPVYTEGSGPGRFHTFQTRSSFTGSTPGAQLAWKKNQRRWIRDQINSGRGIYDIGAPAGAGPSEYVDIEHRELQGAGFTKQCTGAKLMVDGVETPLYEWVPPPGFTPGSYRPRTAAECRGTS